MAIGYRDGRTRTITKQGEIKIENTIVMETQGSNLNNVEFFVVAWYCDYSKAFAVPFYQIVNLQRSSVQENYPSGNYKRITTTRRWTVEFGFKTPYSTPFYKTGQQSFEQIIDQYYPDLPPGAQPTSRTITGEFQTCHWTVNGTYNESAEVVGYFSTALRFAEYRNAGTISITLPGYTYTRDIDPGPTPDTTGADLYSPIPSLMAVDSMRAYTTNRYQGVNGGGAPYEPIGGTIHLIEQRMGSVSQGAHAKWTAYHTSGGFNAPTLASRSALGSTVSWCELIVDPAPAVSTTNHPGGREATGSWGGRPKQQVTVIGNLHDLKGDAYTDTAELQLIADSSSGNPSTGVSYALIEKRTTSSGTASHSWSLYGFSQESTFTRSNNGYSAVENASFSDSDIENIVPGSLNAPRLNGMFAIGFRETENAASSTLEYLRAHYRPATFNAMTLSQAPSGVCFAAPWNPANFNKSPQATITLSGNALRVVTASSGNPYIIPTAPVFLTGYRYLTFRVRSIGSKNRTIRLEGITPRVWEITTGDDGEWVDRTIDLLLPKVTGPRAPVAWDSTAPGSSPIAPPGTWVFPTGGTFEIESVKGVRKDKSWVTVRAYAHPEGADDDGGKQLILGYTDGVITLREFTIAASTEANRKQSLTKIAASINANTAKTGWAATLSVSTATPPVQDAPIAMSYYQSGSAPAMFLEGQGLLDNGSTVSVCRDVNLPRTLAHQPVITIMNVYPGCGDLQNAGGYGSSTTLTFRSLIGSEVAGLVLDPGEESRVEMRRTTPDELRGTGIPRESDGWYVTGTPFGRGGSNVTPARPGNNNINHKAILKNGDSDAANPPTVNVVTRQRERRHVLFFGPGKKIGRNIDAVTHPALGWYGRAHVAPDGKQLKFQRTDGTYRESGSLRESVGILTAGDGETISSPSLVIDDSHTPERLICQFERRSGGESHIFETYSSDDGDTWEDPEMAFEGARTPVIAKSAHGDIGSIIRTSFVQDDSGNGTGYLQATLQNSGDLEQSEPYIFARALEDDTYVPLVVKPVGHFVTHAQDRQASWLLSCTIEGEDEPSDWYSSDECETWTRFTAEV